MSDGKISARRDAANVIVSTGPDVCLTPRGSSMVPVPYTSIAFMDSAIRTSSSVRNNGRQDFQLNSRCATSTGHEPGTGRGVVAPGYKGLAHAVSSSSTVYSEGWATVRHRDPATINSPDEGATEIRRGIVGKAAKPECAQAREKDKQLAAAALQRIKDRAARPAGPLATPCDAMARELSSRIPTFQRYTEALPSARAATDLNQLGNQDDAPQSQPCLTRLPLKAAELNKELGLPPGTITDEMLRNDETGFRAALYRDEATGRLILAGRDTQPTSLVDWQTNIDNGRGKDTFQYRSMRDLSRTLAQNDIPFDLAGYSKGGGLAQMGGLVSPDSKATVFNSAGLPDAALKQAGVDSFDSLTSRTTALSSEDEFLTHMNDTSARATQAGAAYQAAQQQFQQAMAGMGGATPGPFGISGADVAAQYAKQIGLDGLRQQALDAGDAEFDNLHALRDQLAGDSWLVHPIEPTHRNPAHPDGAQDPLFAPAKEDFIRQLDGLIAQREADPFGRGMFPPVRAGTKETIPGSMSAAGHTPGILGRLAQHQMKNVLGPMENLVRRTRGAMQSFLERCP